MNARFPNAAEQVVGTGTWPIGGPPQREIGYGDFAPLNVEFGRSRAPLLDLDPFNASGAKGVDYIVNDVAGVAVNIAETAAKFANSAALGLTSLTVRLVAPPDGAAETFQFNVQPSTDVTDITASVDTSGGNVVLTLRGTGPGGVASVDHFNQVLATIKFVDNSATPTPGMRVITVQAVGGPDFANSNPAVSQTIGNVATAFVNLQPPAAPQSNAMTPAVSFATVQDVSSTPTASVASGSDARIEPAADVSAALSAAANNFPSASSSAPAVQPAAALALVAQMPVTVAADVASVQPVATRAASSGGETTASASPAVLQAVWSDEQLTATAFSSLEKRKDARSADDNSGDQVFAEIGAGGLFA
jgi:hypothetical protein